MARVGTQLGQLRTLRGILSGRAGQIIHSFEIGLRSILRDIINELNSLDSEDWNTLTLENGWTDVGGTDDAEAGYRKDTLNRVHLRGWIDSGTKTANTVIATLPSGYRPAVTKRFMVQTSGGHGRLYIKPNGEITITTASASGTALDGMYFFTD